MRKPSIHLRSKKDILFYNTRPNFLKTLDVEQYVNRNTHLDWMQPLLYTDKYDIKVSLL